MGERMQWSEAEAVVQAYRTEQRLRSTGAAAPKRRFIDRSGLVRAALAGAVAVGLLAFIGPSLLAHHPVLAALAPKPTLIEAPMAPPTPVLARVLIRTAPGDRGIVHLRSLIHDEDM